MYIQGIVSKEIVLESIISNEILSLFHIFDLFFHEEKIYHCIIVHIIFLFYVKIMIKIISIFTNILYYFYFVHTFFFLTNSRRNCKLLLSYYKHIIFDFVKFWRKIHNFCYKNIYIYKNWTKIFKKMNILNFGWFFFFIIFSIYDYVVLAVAQFANMNFCNTSA